FGTPSNTSRPGGPIFVASIQAPGGTFTYHLVADNETVHMVASAIAIDCLVKDTPMTQLDESGLHPRPAEVIRYFRNSSIALTLDDNNNTAAFLPPNSTIQNSSLPPNLNTTFKDCLEGAIYAAAPILD
ncbi:hypothetical protein M422DRAFT_124603, partial [Sphaerobolus stellatus SS14]